MVHNTQAIILTRTILTTPGRVYAAFTTPEGWTSWCCETAECDPRLGGKLHIYTQGYHAYGKFTELEQDRLVAFTWDGDNEPPTLIQVELGEQGGNTVIEFKVTVLGSEQDFAGIAAFLERTWGRVLDNLKSVLESGPPT